MVKLLACGARGPGFDFRFAVTISDIGYLLLQVATYMAEISLKWRKSSKQQQKQKQQLF